MSTILTAAGESLIARLQAEGKALIIDTMILANVPGQDHTQAIAPGVTVPAEAQIALRYAIPPQYRAYVNPNQVVYSAMLGSDMGDFTFNWQGLWCSEHNTLVAVATFPALEKRRYDEANGKTGNNLTRNFLLTFTGARELTGLTISADVWQLDFTVRLNGIDERQRLANFDIYGQAFFDADGWLLQKTAEAYAFAPGLGYVGGIRAALAESLPLAAPESANLPQNVWLDVCLKHTGSDRVAEASPMLAPPAAPLADSAADETGLMHYRALVARIEADGTVTDLRPRKTSGALPIPDVATPEVAGTSRPDGKTISIHDDVLQIVGSRHDWSLPVWRNNELVWLPYQRDIEGDVHIYVASNGDDAAEGSEQHPIKTIAQALEISRYYQRGTHVMHVHIAPGDYGEMVFIDFTSHYPNIKILGSGAKIKRLQAYGSGNLRIEGLEVTLPEGGQGEMALSATFGAAVIASGVSVTVGGASASAVGAAYGGSIAISDSTINSLGTAWSALLARGGYVFCNKGGTIRTAFTSARGWASSDGGGFLASVGAIFSGVCTGARYFAGTNGIIDTQGGGANYFPGSSAGSTYTGGQYQ